jgi:carboxyl-terminal processing protease
MDRCKKAIDFAKQLKNGDTLTMRVAIFRNINPELQINNINARASEEWLKKLSKDIYLAETISILDEMASTDFAN